MWTQFIILAAGLATACGMCFGVPPYKQSVDCPSPMVYYAPLCVCLQPTDKSRIHKVGTNRPLTMKNLVHPLSPTYSDNLSAQRYRLTASLPDMPGYAFGSSVSAMRQSPLLFTDPMMTFSPLSSNQLPRSWQIIGNPEFWSRAAFVGRDIPTMSAAMQLMAVKNLEAMAMMDTLKMMRSKWRQRSLAKAKYASPKFLSKLYPISSKVMPDVGSSFPSAAGELIKDIHGKQLYGMKSALFAAEQDLTNRRDDSFVRGLMKLKS